MFIDPSISKMITCCVYNPMDMEHVPRKIWFQSAFVETKLEYVFIVWHWGNMDRTNVEKATSQYSDFKHYALLWSNIHTVI